MKSNINWQLYTRTNMHKYLQKTLGKVKIIGCMLTKFQTRKLMVNSLNPHFYRRLSNRKYWIRVLGKGSLRHPTRPNLRVHIYLPTKINPPSYDPAFCSIFHLSFDSMSEPEAKKCHSWGTTMLKEFSNDFERILPRF